MLADNRDFFNTFNLSSISVENNDLNFDEFITNCKAISHASNSDKWKEKKNVKDDSYDNINEFVVKCIPEQPQEEELPLAMQIIVYETELMVRKNVGKRTENEKSQVLPEISELGTTAVNISSIVISEDIPDPNWHISFMVLTKKRILHSYLTQILLKTGSTSPLLRYLQNLWHIDFGATNHICVSRQRFVKYHFIFQKEDIWTGAGSVQAIGKGTVQIELTKSDGSHSFIKIHNVLHVLMFMTNLISILLLREKGIYWRSDDFTLRKMQDQSEVAIGKLIGNLSIFSTNDWYEFALLSQIANVTKPDIKIIYCCLGHSNVDSIIKLISMSTGIEMPNSISKFFCKICMLAKQAKHISKDPATKALLPGERIYTDLVGPITPIRYDGSKYGLLLTNDALRTTMEVLLKNKNQVKVELPKYTEKMQTQYRIIIQAFPSDNEGEYIDQELQTWASKKGIKWKYMVPYNPYQNGVSKRVNCTFEEKLRNMIIDSGISKQLWPLGFLWSVQLKNCSPTSALPDCIPFQALTGKLPNLTPLRIFGCRAYVYIPKEKQMQSAKWDPRSEQCIFVGYDSSGIYQLWNGHRVICSKDVIFDERPIQLSNAKSLLPSNGTVPQPKLSQSSGTCGPISIKIFDKVLENDGGDRFDHSYMPINASHANTDSSLTSLASTPDLTLTSGQSLTSVSNATSL